MEQLGGHEIYTQVGGGNATLYESCPIIVGQRLGKPEVLTDWRRLWPNHRLVYEIDDDVWSIDQFNFSARRGHQDFILDAHLEAMRYSHLITVTTPILAEKVREFNSNVVVLPNFIDGRATDLVRPQRMKFVVGWAGGDSHMRDLLMVADPLHRFLRRNPTAEFHNVGTDFRRIINIEGRYTGWGWPIFDYYRNLDFDVGLAPLASIEFNRSKSHIKAIEYMALGIPVIASDMEPYRDVIQHGVTGFLVRQAHEWPKYLYELFRDRDLREKMGAAGRQYVKENWTIQKGWKLWEEAYRGLGMPVGFRTAEEMAK